MTPEQARADERAKVVEWLRDRGDAMAALLPNDATSAANAALAIMAGARFQCADAIERGDHHKEQGE